MSTMLSLLVRGISYTAILDGAATTVLDSAGALVGCVRYGADAALLDACLPEALPAALELVRSLVAAEKAEAEALGLATLRQAQGRRVAEAHWRMMALVHAVRADQARAELAALSVAIGVAA